MKLMVLSICLLPSPVFADAVTDYNLALQFYKQQRWELSAEACEDFVKKYPKHVQVSMAHLYWGQSLVHLREFGKARNHFRIYLNDPKAISDRPLAMYRVGECSYFLNDAKAAEQELTVFLRAYKDHELAEWASVYLAHSHFQLNKNKEAISTFEASLEKYKNGNLKEEAEYGLARALEVDGQFEKAVELYRKISSQKGNLHAGEALFHMAAMYFSQEKYAEADQHFQSLTKQFSNHRLAPLAFLNAGYAMYQLKKFPEAIQRFEQAAQSEAQRATANYWIGLSYKSLGEYKKASQIFKETLALAPDQALAENLTFQRGDAELRQEHQAEAMTIFETVYTKWPEGKYADDALHSACEAAFQAGDLTKATQLHQLFSKRYATGGLSQVQELLYGRILISSGDQKLEPDDKKSVFYQHAATILKRVVETSKVNETGRFARFQLARAYERLGDDAKLLSVLKPLLDEQSPTTQLTLDSLLLVANAKLRQEDYDGAIADYQKFVSNSDSVDFLRAAYAGLISAQLAKNDWSVITKNLKELELNDPQGQHFQRLSLAAGDAAFEAEEWKQAAEFFQMSSARKKNNDYYLAARSGLGHTFYQQGEFGKSAQAFSDISQSDTTDMKLGTHSLYMLGMAYRQAGNAELSLKAFRDGLEKYQVPSKTAEVEVQETVYNLAKGAARIARDLKHLEEADGLYQSAFDQIQILPPNKSVELDKLIYEWADMHYNSKDYVRADELFRLLIKERPQSELADDAALILAESLRFSDQKSEAEQAFRKLATDANVDDFVRQRSFIHLVDLGAEEQQWKQVLSDAQALQKQHPQNDHQLYLKYRIAEASLQLNLDNEANELLQELRTEIIGLAKEAPSWWEEVWVLQAESFLRQSRYPDLVEVIEDLRKRSPESKIIHRGDMLVGRSEEKQANFEAARAAYARVIESKSGNGTETAAEAQFRIAESLLKQKNYKMALIEYYKVYAGYNVPVYEAAAMFQAGRSEISMKNWKGAVQSFRILIQEFPESEHVPDAKKQLLEIEKTFPELKKEVL